MQKRMIFIKTLSFFLLKYKFSFYYLYFLILIFILSKSLNYPFLFSFDNKVRIIILIFPTYLTIIFVMQKNLFLTILILSFLYLNAILYYFFFSKYHTCYFEIYF